MERYFFGIIPKPVIATQLAAKCQSAKEAFPSGIKWVNPHDMHILLKDVMPSNESKRDLLTNCVIQLQSRSFPVQLSAMKIHPTYSHSGSFHTVQCNVTCGGNHFHQLLDEIDQFVALCEGVERKENRNTTFRPRIVLGRNSGSITRRIFKPWLQANNFQDPLQFEVDDFHLICARQIENGPMQYEIVRTFPLIQRDVHIDNNCNTRGIIHESSIIEATMTCKSTTRLIETDQNIEISTSSTIVESTITTTATTVTTTHTSIDTSIILDNNNRPETFNLEAPASIPATKERIFIGIKLPSEAAISLQNRYKPHQPSLPHVKWEKDENLHITLRFIGDLSSRQRQDLQEQLSLCFSQNTFLTHFPAQLTNYSIFPKKGEFRILHCAVEEATEEAFQRLKQAVDACVVACGISIDDKVEGFVPHVTLARNRKAKRSNVLSWIQSQREAIVPASETTTEAEGTAQTFPIDFVVTDVQLFRSHLSSDGATYEVLQSYSLSRPHA